MKHKIAILIPYFGRWPVWINFFVESCRWNKDIDWYLFSDSDQPENRCRNVHYRRFDFDAYKSLISEALGIRFNPRDPYKLCDLRPALPFIHRDLLTGYDFVGFGDLDVIYGNIRHFYDDQVLSSYDLLSTHADRISGHLCLMRNEERILTAFKRIAGWKGLFEQEGHAGVDERQFYKLFRPTRLSLAQLMARRQPRCFFHESYSTPGPDADMRWRWEKGLLINEHYPHHPFMYLHFMNWHSSRWYKDQRVPDANRPAPWSQLPKVVQVDWREARRGGFCISRNGIHPLHSKRERQRNA